MATTSKMLTRANMNVGSTLYYTTPLNGTVIVTNIAVTNTTSNAATFSLELETFPLHSATSIPANSTVYIDCKQVMNAAGIAKQITGTASTTGLVLHISGVEIV